MNTVHLLDNKYTITFDDSTGKMTFYRHSEPWPAAQNDFQHAGVISALVQRVIELENPTVAAGVPRSSAGEYARVASDATAVEVGEQASIDTPEFVNTYGRPLKWKCGEQFYSELITHIDAHTQQAVADALAGREATYKLLLAEEREVSARHIAKAVIRIRRAEQAEAERDAANKRAEQYAEVIRNNQILAQQQASNGQVPVEPTEEMLSAARDWSVKKYGMGIGNDAASGCWKAMLFTAPQPAPVANDTPGTELYRLQEIIAACYQIAGAHDVPEFILDVLCDPLAATQEQIDKLLPYAPVARPVDERAAFEKWCRSRDTTPLRLKGTDQYMVAPVQAAWVAWRDRAALATPPAISASKDEK